MSDPIYDIIKRLSLVEGKTTPVSVRHGLNPQQQGVPQLPALFKPKNISTTLTKKPYQKHPADGYMVGDSVEPRKPSLGEAMQEVEEDMVSRVKGQFADYLEKLEKENKLDSHLVNKAKHDLDIGDDGEVDENATWDQDVAPIGDPADTEVAHGLENDVATAVSQPTAPLGESPAKTYTLEDGTCLEAYGDDKSGYEVRHGERRLPTRFPRIDHADMAVKLFQKRRQRQDQSQDYIEEK